MSKDYLPKKEELKRMKSAPASISKSYTVPIEQRTASQVELWKSLDSPHNWSIPKYILTQQMQGYLLEVFRKNNNLMEQAQIVESCNQVKGHLLRKNFTQYGPADNMEKIVVGTLHGINFFSKDPGSNNWRLVIDKANVWELKELDKIASQQHMIMMPAYFPEMTLMNTTLDPEQFLLADEPQLYQKPPYNIEVAKKQLSNQSVSVLGKREQRAVLQDIESKYKRYKEQHPQLTSSMLPDLSSFDQVMISQGTDKMLGMLHAFTLLKPLIQEKLIQEEKRLVEPNRQPKLEQIEQSLVQLTNLIRKK